MKDAEKYAPRILMLLGILLVVTFFLSFGLGRYTVPVTQVVRILLYKICQCFASNPFSGWIPVFAKMEQLIEVTWTPEMEAAVWMLRLPRILLACLVGGCLAIAGASYQGVFQNPMAAPDILGASSGAAFGAALAILWDGNTYVITISAFACAMATVLVVYLVAHYAPGVKIVNLILAGVMISSLCSAATSYIKLVADPEDQLPAITYWMMGSLSGAKMKEIQFVIIPMALGIVPLILIRWQINLLTLGEEEAHALGVNTNRIRFLVIICATLTTAAAVSVSGMIGWVGLVIPHFCRKLVGSNYRYLMPAALMSGAFYLLLVDDVARNLISTELPIGILTAFVGAPFFLYLIMKQEAGR